MIGLYRRAGNELPIKKRIGLMNVIATTRAASAQSTEHFDVLIVGAGISGIGSAYHLIAQLPGTSFVVLEAQESFGGTWLTHRYPGIRSDSDLHTFGYRFKPWTSAPIATAAEIRSYMGEVIAENGLEKHIRYRHKISSTSWFHVPATPGTIAWPPSLPSVPTSRATRVTSDANERS